MRRFFITNALLLVVSLTFGQLTGTKTIPGDYATLAAAIADLNTQGVGPGGVTIELLAGNPETAPAGGYEILASGNPNSPIIIKGNGNTITAYTPQSSGAINDAIFKIIGGDYITIDGFVMQENPANTITNENTNDMTEFGVALFYASATDGPQNCTIQNNTIILGDNYQNAFGIYANSCHTATNMTTSADISSPAGAFSYLKVINNTISSVNLGIVLVGSLTAANMATNVEVTGNNVSFGRTGTFSSYVSVSGSVNGIQLNNVLNATVTNNIFISNATCTSGTLRGIYHNASGTLPTTGNYSNLYANNTIVLTNAGTGAMNGIHVDNLNANFTTQIIGNVIQKLNSTVATSATIYGIYHQGSSLNQNILQNQIWINTNSSGNVYAIHGGNTLPANGVQTVQDNLIIIKKSVAGGTVCAYFSASSSPASATKNILNNVIDTISVTGSTTITVINELDGGTPIKNISNNIIRNITGGTSSSTGINLSYTSTATISNNQIYNITNGNSFTAITAGSSSATNVNTFGNIIHDITVSSGNINGILAAASATGANSNVYKNVIYKLTANGTISQVGAIVASAGTNVNIYNNFISELYAPNVSSTVPNVSSIVALGGTNVNVVYNTVYLNATSSGTDFSSACFYANTTPTNVLLQNNIFVNNSTANGTGKTVAIWRIETDLTKYNVNSNNNCLYAGTPSASNVLYFDGTNGYQDLLTLTTALTPRESSTISMFPAFVNTTTSPFDLHIQPSIPTGLESGGIIVTGIDNDIDNEIRFGSTGYAGTGTAPDIGADEFEGTPSYTCTTPTPGNTLASENPVCYGNSVTLSMENPTPGTGVSYQWQSSNDGTNYTDITGATSATYVTSISQSTYYRCKVTCLNGPSEAYSTPIQLTFAYEITSTTPGSRCGIGPVTLEATGTGNTISWYDAPSGGNLVGTGSPFNTPNLNNTTTYYVASENITTNPGTVTVGNGTTTNTTSGYPTAFGNYWYQTWQQFIITAAELQALGLEAGNITAISFNLVTLPNPNNPPSDYQISLGSTSNTTLSTWQTSGLTTCFGPDVPPTLSVGWNTITFTNPYYWDGTSNIIIDIRGTENYGNANARTTNTTQAGNMTIYAYSMSNNANFWNSNPTPIPTTARMNVRLQGQVKNVCSSPRVPVTATVIPSTPITITDDVTVCNNEVVMLEVTSGASGYDQITWTPEANLFTDASCTTPYVAGTNATQVYFKTTTAGNHVITCNAYNTSTDCASSDNVTVTVLPLSVTLTASPDKICQSGSTTISVDPNTGWSTATFEWYESTDGNTWNLIPSANGLTVTSSTINATTYYQFKALLGTNVCVAQDITIDVQNPAITNVTDGNICGYGQANLSATANSSTATILWYEQATGGYPVATGENFTTPLLNAPTTYYAEPFEENITFNIGHVSDPSSALISFSQQGMYFATTDAVIINSVEIYPSTAGTLNVALVNELSQIVDVRSFTITSSDVSNTTKKLLNLDFYVPAAVTGWMLYYDLAIYRGAGTYNYPYTANGFSITGNTQNGNNITGGTRMYFYNWNVTKLCTGQREAVNVNYTTPDPISITSSANQVCAGTNITLEAQSNNSNYTYTWSNNITGNSIDVVPTSTADYSVTATDPLTGCVTSANITLEIYPLPTATATASPSSIICGQSVQLNAGELYTPEVYLETFNGTTHSFTAINTSSEGNPTAAAWTLRQSGYVYGGNTFVSPDNSQFIMSNSDAQGSGGTTHTELISQPVSTVGIDSMTIQFQQYYRHYSGSTIKVEISDGSQWTSLQTWTATQGAPNNFVTTVIPVPNSFMNNPNIQVRFVYDATWGYYWAIDNAQVNLLTANSFNWTSQPLGFTSSVNNPTDEPVVTTDYIVTVTSSKGCTSTASVTVTVNNPPAPTVTVNNTCDQSELTVSNYNGTINWSTGETTETIYVTNANPVTVTYTVGNCTSDAATANPAPIQTPDQPVVSDLEVCFGETVPAFNATSNYNQFVWYSDAQLTDQIGTGANYQSTETTPGTYTYYVVAINNGCESTPEEVTLTIHALPTVSITQNGDTLFSSASAGNQWYDSQGPIAGATDDYYVVTAEDDYYVVVTDVNGCSAISNIIHVIPTHVAQNEWNNMIAIHPNPAHNYTIVSLGKLNDAIIQIVNMDGRILSEINTTNNKQTVSLKGIASGIYTVRVIAGDKIVNKKLIVE